MCQYQITNKPGEIPKSMELIPITFTIYIAYQQFSIMPKSSEKPYKQKDLFATLGRLFQPGR